VSKDLEIVDDAGDEFYATNIPIPFYIRLKLDSEKTKYRAKILDESGNTRSFYTGVTDRNFLELHVPVIPLPDKGKIIVEIEVSDIGSEDSTKHQATIDYVSQEEYESIKKLETPKKVEDVNLPAQKEDVIDEQEESAELTSEELAYLTQTTDSFNVVKEVEEDVEVKEQETEVSPQFEEPIDELERSAELSANEVAYLTQSEVTIEDVKEEVKIGEAVTDGSVQLEELDDGPERSAELSVDELSYLTQRKEIIEIIEEDVEIQEFETRASVQLEELTDEPERLAELSVDEIAYLTQRAEILSESVKKEEEEVTEQILSVDSDEEE
jgi:hypothetical protein